MGKLTKSQRAELLGYLLERFPPHMAEAIVDAGIQGGGPVLPAIAMVATLASTAVGIASQVQQGEYQAKQAQHNAKVAGWQRSDAVQRGAQEASRFERAGRSAAERGLAVGGAGGLDTTDGSIASLFDASAVNARLDAEAARASGHRQAWGFTNEAQDLQARARNARRAGILGGIGTGLSGFGQLVGQGGDLAARYP